METASGGRVRTSRLGALDGIRGLAIAGVLAYHAAPGLVPGGFLGVEVFFVLSGFLLTSLLLSERQRTGAIDRWSYARRRVRRVGPALVFLLLGVVVAGGLFAPDDAHRLPGDIASALTGVTNWHLIQNGSSYFRDIGRPSLLRHLWSLAIEMQFYVVCPFLVSGLARLRRGAAATLLTVAIGGSSAAMAFLYRPGDPSRAYFGSEARVGGVLAGVLVAVMLAELPASAPKVSRRAVSLAGGVGLTTLLLLFALTNERSRTLYPAGFLVCRVATAAVLLAAVRSGPVAMALRARPLRWLGQRSYGIYLWHWPILALTRPGIDVGWPRWLTTVALVAGALIMGELSFRMFERPFMGRRQARVPGVRTPTRWGALRWPAVTAALVGTGVIAASLPTGDPLVAGLQAGADVVAAQPLPPSNLFTTTTSAPPVVVEAPAVVLGPAEPVSARVPRTQPAPPPPPSPPGSVAVTAIGDSVMLGAAPQLQARFGPAAYIDAKVSRQFNDGVQEARRLRDEGRLGQVVYVHLGTNGPPRASDVDALMDILAGVPNVRLVNVRVNRSWQNATNRTLADGVARHPTVQLVDWFAASEGHREWFRSDGTHTTPAGADAFANLLAASMPPPPPPPTTTTAPPPSPPPATTTTTTPVPTFSTTSTSVATEPSTP